MKIIHTSDWHLGARLHEEDRSQEQKSFLDWFLELMKAERPDALVVAGDVFDVKAPSPQAQALYYEFLAKAATGGLCRRIVVTAGNHDNSKLLAAPSSLLVELGICVVSVAGDGEAAKNEVVVVEGKDGNAALAIAAVPFMFDAELANFGRGETDADAPREERVLAGWAKHYGDVVAAARAAAPGVPLVVTGHCTLTGTVPSDKTSERHRRIGGIDAYDPKPLAGADYVALGHLHRSQAVRGYEDRMFYSGSPLRMSFDEADCKKHVNVVELGVAGEPPRVRLVDVPQTVPILTVEGTPDDVRARLDGIAAEKDKLLYVRLRLKDFKGEARPYWEEFRARVQGTGMRVLEENDMRPVAPVTAGLKAIAKVGIKNVDPRDLAERKLRTSSGNFDDTQVSEYMALYDMAEEEAKGGAA